MIDVELVDFLQAVWGEEEGYVDLPSKVNGRWVPAVIEWPNRGAARRRIDSCLRDEEDVYFSVGIFAKQVRDRDQIRPSAWLWADLDEVDPEELATLGLLPTVAWESSPGRYHALWGLDRFLAPRLTEQLNRMLTYTIGADRGGWDLTQVLRIPGTRNYKYRLDENGIAPKVELLWFDDELEYVPRELFQQLKKLGAPTQSLQPSEGEALPTKVKLKGLPPRVRRLLRTPADQIVVGERSARLWELECLLCEHGMDQEGIFQLVRRTAWNKHAELGKSRGDRALRREIARAMDHVVRRDEQRAGSGVKAASPPSPEDKGVSDAADKKPVDEVTQDGLPFENYASFISMDMEAPRWLVEGIWTASSHGIIGGEPKTSKSVLSLALALAVASGKPFLGKFPVATAGPVLVIQEENAPWQMQDRLRKLAAHSGLIRPGGVEVEGAPKGSLGSEVVNLDFPDDLPLFILNNYGFDLTLEEHREALEFEVDRMRPVLLVLDPLYLLLGGVDTDKSHSLSPFFKWLLYLRFEYNCAIAVVHHMAKRHEQTAMRRAGQRLMGSTTLHGFVESALYCENTTTDQTPPDETSVRILREFRNVAPRKPLDVSLKFGAPGDLKFKATVLNYDASGKMVAAVRDEPGITLTQVAEVLGIHKNTARKIAVGSGEIDMRGGSKGRGHSWRLYLSDNGHGE